MLQTQDATTVEFRDIPAEKAAEPAYYVRGIPFNMIEQFWQYAEPYVKRALDHANGEFTPLDLKKSCLVRDAQLWLVMKKERIVAAAITQIVNYPQRRHARVITLAGTGGDEWTAILDDALHQWGKANGCNAIEAFVRKGYVQKLAQYGYKHKYSCIIKEM